MSATVVIALPSITGSQPYAARMPATSANATSAPIGSAIAARYQPGALSLAAIVTPAGW